MYNSSDTAVPPEGGSLIKPIISDALRYLGAEANASDDMRQQVSSTAEALVKQLRPRYTYRVFDLTFSGKEICLMGTNVTLTGSSAHRMLTQCCQAVLLACTLGSAFDRMLLSAQARDMAQAVILDACGSAYVESGCDDAERELAARFPDRFLTDRFSPGYSDLPLSLQPDLCAALDTPRRLGLHVTKSLLLNPVKSVTAVIGLSDRPQPARIRGCAYCRMRETCSMRKGGNHCGN